MAEIKVTKENFASEVLASEKPVVVDFWATWCGPCRMIAPVLEELAEKYEDKLTVGKVNVDEEMELAVKFSVASIPTLMVFKGGEMVAKTLGYMPLEKVEGWLKEAGVL
ncbi:MAG: thioredoxin [Clostridiales bacterium]|nr:thioredoxin [Clostridiales bacterium]